MWFFRWIREQVRDSVLGGFRDAAEELELTEPQLRSRLGLPPPEARALPAAPEPEEPAKGKRK
jgi:hypothetical protein